jgi:hypothetical protein
LPQRAPQPRPAGRTETLWLLAISLLSERRGHGGELARRRAVDRMLAIVSARFGGAALVDFKGDLACHGVPADGPWQVGVDGADGGAQPPLLLELSQGAVASISDAHDFLLRDGVRYATSWTRATAGPSCMHRAPYG